jgi:phosphoglycolate phosphatase
MTLRKPALVLFDLDGTLIDTAPDLAWSIDFTLKQLNLPLCGEDKVRAWVGSGIEGLMKRALTMDFNGQPDSHLLEEAMSIFKECYFDNICERSRIYPGVKEALAYLHARNYKIACVTNKSGRFTDKLLQMLGLYNEFGIIVSGDTLPLKKPHAAPLLHAAAHFSIEANEALMIGDSITDVSAARAAGCQIICVSYGYNKGRDVHELEPDAVVETLGDLKYLI